MLKTLRVLAIIGVVASLVQVCALLVDIRTPTLEGNEYAPIITEPARLRWMIYWPSGLLVLIIGMFIRKKAELLSISLSIGGAYLMLLGNNGGLWSAGHEVDRFGTSIATLIILGLITFRLDRAAGIDKLEDQSWNKSREDNSALGSPGRSQA